MRSYLKEEELLGDLEFCVCVVCTCMYRKSAKVRVKNVHFLNVRVKKYSRSQDSCVLQCIVLKTFVRLMFAVLAIHELFLTVNFCRFTVYTITVFYWLIVAP